MIQTSSARAFGGFGRTTMSRNAYSRAQVVRRGNATKTSTPTSQAAPESAKTIPGPTWLWLEPIYGPFRAYGRLHQRRPYATQFASSLVIYFVGDLVAQSLSIAPAKVPELATEEEGAEVSAGGIVQKIRDRDWARTGRALLIGGLAAIPGYRWFLWLSKSFNYSSKALSLTTKVLVNQALFTPLFNSYFFGMQHVLSGRPLADLPTHLEHTVPTSVINSCKLWPAVTAFMFTYVPLHYRSIFGGVIAIGWQTYLSLLNQRAAATEDGKHALEEGVSTATKMECERREKVTA
ncbi:hypothetical protein BDV96DRAFT_562848 [Lophiotrema nucula]|uniref:Uncharacterized protein n=1 Tax=Lophiotrema nucula TaxID=690887 RepID=A0A6A5ZSS8_9PLEO|nr:hypothetical protein BDV96DRAFT_562848 [Lophiotrema nucula]